MERNDWQVKFNWIKAHARHHGNEMADQLAKEAANSKRINEGYNRIPKSAVMCELNKQSITQWKMNGTEQLKLRLQNHSSPNITDRLKMRINVTPNYTTLITGHGIIKTYLYKYKILDTTMCSCEGGDLTVDHILFNCKILENERNSLIAAVSRSENWLLSKNELSVEFYKSFKEFTNKICFDEL